MNSNYDYFQAVSRNVGWVTLAEQTLLSKKRVAIAGMGGVGGAHLITLVRLGITRFHVADFDEFGVENFNRQAGAKMSSVGQPKLKTLIQMAQDINPEIDIVAFEEGVTAENIDVFLRDVDVYVDGLDFFALQIRRLMFDKAYKLGIPSVTCAPLGMGVSNLNFLPGAMTFEEYFQMEGYSEQEQYLRFFVGLSPGRLHSPYLVVPEAINLPAKKGPSTIMACELCAGVAATQVLKLLLNRGTVVAAPRCLQFDAYRNKFKISWRPGGNKNWLNKLAISIGTKMLLNQAPQRPPRLSPIADPLLYVLDQARWAPSGDNTQVWRFKRTGEFEFEIHANDTRDWVVYDLKGEASNMAHGALLETASIAASTLGFRLDVIAIDRSQETKPIYRCQLAADSTVRVDELAAYVELRSVQRKPMGTRRLSIAEKQALESSLPNGFKVHWFEDFDSKLQVAKLMYGSAYTRLIMQEGFDVHSKIIEWNARFSKDKIPDQALGVDLITAKLMKWTLGKWERFEFFAKYLGGTVLPRVQLDFMTSIRCSAHFILYADKQTTTLDEQVDAGRALQRFWLTAAKLGIGFQPEQTPVIFSNYINQGVVFSKNSVAVKNAQVMDERLKTLVPEVVYTNKVFFGRLGRSNLPTSRSLRLELDQLLLP
jgi:molybdopterin/thiamine biosynthesis adenylyltransferase